MAPVSWPSSVKSVVVAWLQHALSGFGAAAIQGKYKKSPSLWKQRPLPKVLLRSAAEDVAQLGKLADEMIASLGSELTAHVMVLSTVYSESHWDARDTGKTSKSSPASTSRQLTPWLGKLYAKAVARG